MHMTKKALIIVAVLVTIVFSSCGDKHNTSSPRTPLTVMIYDRGDVPEGAGTIADNAITRCIQENFGDPNNIDISYVPIKRENELEVSVLLASGDAPDIITYYSIEKMYRNYIDGYTIDLTDYLSEADNLVNFLGEELMSYGVVDGKQVMIPAKRLISGRQAQLVRKDWLDKIGMAPPTNTDEFYEMLCKFKELDPGGNGDKNIPYGISANFANYMDLVNCFLDCDYQNYAFMNCHNRYTNPGFKDGIRFLNKLYNEGLVSKNFEFDNERKKVESDIANGYVGFFCDDLGRPLQAGGVYEQLKKNVPGAELVAVDTWTCKDGSRSKCVYDGAGLFIGVSSTCKYPENAIKYLNWMADSEVLRTLQYGFEGVTYQYDENQYPVVIESRQSRMNHWYNLGFDLSLIVNGKYSSDKNKIVDINAAATVDPELYKACYENSVRDGWVTHGFISGSSGILSNSVALGEVQNKFIYDGITCKPEEFDSVFDNLMTQYLELGDGKFDECVALSYKDYMTRYGK